MQSSWFWRRRWLWHDHMDGASGGGGIACLVGHGEGDGVVPCLRGIQGNHVARLYGGALVYLRVYVEYGVVVVGRGCSLVGVGHACLDGGGVLAV